VHLVEVYHPLGTNIEMDEKGLNYTPGQLYARMFCLQERMVPFVMNGQNVLREDLQGNLQRDIRSAYNDVTTATQTLAGEIQRHFLVVILFIGSGLHSELGSLWRPTQQVSLDSFDEIQQMVEAGIQARHNLWKVRCKTANQDLWFAIKEYSTGQRGSLRTCLKEAATAYEHTFRVTTLTNTSMQMP